MADSSRSPEDQVSRFCHQYLQVEQRLDYPDTSLLKDGKIQEELFQRVFDRNSLSHLPPPAYQLRTLKELITRIESSIEDWDEHAVSDNLMDSLSGLFTSHLPSEAASAQQKCYVTYHLSTISQPSSLSTPHITLLETPFLISAAGTTGLRTWEAALHLGQYLCSQPSKVRDKRVLELGAGTGYLSVLCAKHLEASQVIASDGSDDVVNNLPDNFFLNDLQGDSVISPMDLKWGHALTGTEEKEWNGGRTIDLVTGADITYDPSIIPALVGTLDELVSLFPDVDIIIAATERNKSTFETFLDISRKRGFAVTLIDFPVPRRDEQTGPFYSDGSPIHICHLQYRAG